MKIGIVGTGYVADYYMATLPNHPHLQLAAVTDHDPDRLAAFARHHRVTAVPDLATLLADESIGLVLNLTTPESHFAVSRAMLEAGRHVYSEKPLAMSMAEARALVDLAAARRLSLSSAPSSVLGEAPQAAWKAIRDGRIGQPRLVYAEMEDGPVFRDRWREWRSPAGAPWPGAHEFEIGVTLEHAGYYLTWLCAFFGPVREMTAFAATVFPDKGVGEGHSIANDLSVACLTFESGVIARLSTGLAAPRDRAMQIIGDEGVITIQDGWDSRSPVRLRREGHGAPRSVAEKLRAAAERRLNRILPGRLLLGERLPLRAASYARPDFPSRMDFMRGPAEQARAIAEGRASRLPADFALHVTELALALQQANTLAQPFRPRSRFAPLMPMEWA
jgi:predicted dehydrogenase